MFYMAEEMVSMKRILIVTHAMEIGGAEKALLGLLETIDTAKYQVDLFLMSHRGELMKYIPENINLLPEIPQYACMARPVSEVIEKHLWSIGFGRAIGKAKAGNRVKKLGLSKDNNVALEYSHRYTLKFMPKIQPDMEYDLAVSFLAPHYFTMEKVTAKKKIAWIHTDYSSLDIDAETELKVWNKYDRIISISDDVTYSFLKKFPEVADKILLIENIMPVKYIETVVDKFTVEHEMPEDGSIKLLSIGRFSFAKKFEDIPEICRHIRLSGMNVKWYIIGYGTEETLIRQRISEMDMQDYVIILGKKENPYPYIKACDIYVQPSRYEGKSVVVREAQMLHKPVVITNYPTASSQIKDGVDGIIVPMDIRACADGIAALIIHKELQRRLIDNTKKKDYANICEIKKLYML